MAKNIKELLELAVDHIDYWDGTLVAKLLEYDIENNDYDALEEHIKQSMQMMFDAEYGEEIAQRMTDERAEAMYQENL